MKIKDLDRNEVYGLEEIKKDAVKFDALKEWLRNNDNWNSDNLPGLDDALDLFYSMEFRGWYHDSELKITKCALTLFELDVTDYQVDCSELSKEQIEEMAEAVKSKGYKVWGYKYALCVNIMNDDIFFADNGGGEFFINFKQDYKTTITYDKFIELFGEKEQWIQSDFGQYKLTEQGLVFHYDFDFELYKEIGGLNKINKNIKAMKDNTIEETHILTIENSEFLKDLIITKFPYCDVTTRRIANNVFHTMHGKELVIEPTNWYFREVKKQIEQAEKELSEIIGADVTKPVKYKTNALNIRLSNSDFKQITDSISDLLDYKNKKYGNSALEPLNIFTNKCKVGQRLDDKLARVKNSSELKKNDVADLIGYLILTCKENNWTNFDEFKD